jgi:transposase
MRLADQRPDWVLGYLDETWWSRVTPPSLQSWAPAGQPLRLVEPTIPPDDPDPKALACYGLLVPGDDSLAPLSLRFVDGRPVSAVTIQFLRWCAEQLTQAGKTALLLVWDNASWHVSAAVRTWLRQHNRQVKQTGTGIRIISCLLPTKSPWLNPIEPVWRHGKRRVVEPDRLLSAHELAERICAVLNCAHEPHLSLTEEVA